MDNKEAYNIIAKHIFTAYKTYSENYNTIIIFADNKEIARQKAQKYFQTLFITVSELKITQKEGVYKI